MRLIDGNGFLGEDSTQRWWADHRPTEDITRPTTEQGRRGETSYKEPKRRKEQGRSFRGMKRRHFRNGRRRFSTGGRATGPPSTSHRPPGDGRKKNLKRTTQSLTAETKGQRGSVSFGLNPMEFTDLRVDSRRFPPGNGPQDHRVHHTVPLVTGLEV